MNGNVGVQLVFAAAARIGWNKIGSLLLHRSSTNPNVVKVKSKTEQIWTGIGSPTTTHFPRLTWRCWDFFFFFFSCIFFFYLSFLFLAAAFIRFVLAPLAASFFSYLSVGDVESMNNNTKVLRTAA